MLHNIEECSILTSTFVQDTQWTQMFHCLIKNSAFHSIAQTSEVTAVRTSLNVLQQVVGGGAWSPSPDVLFRAVLVAPHSAGLSGGEERRGGREEGKAGQEEEGCLRRALHPEISGEGCQLCSSSTSAHPVFAKLPSVADWTSQSGPRQYIGPIPPNLLSSDCHSSPLKVGSVFPDMESGGGGCECSDQQSSSMQCGHVTSEAGSS